MTPRSVEAVYQSIRGALGLLILGAGIGKALDVAGFVGVMRTYEMPLPEASLVPLAWGTIAFEVVLGAWVLAGLRMTIAALLSVAMHAGYFVLLGSALVRGLELSNCGCFGVFLARPLRWYSPLEDVALMAVSLVLYALARRRAS